MDTKKAFELNLDLNELRLIEEGLALAVKQRALWVSGNGTGHFPVLKRQVELLEQVRNMAQEVFK